MCEYLRVHNNIDSGLPTFGDERDFPDGSFRQRLHRGCGEAVEHGSQCLREVEQRLEGYRLGAKVRPDGSGGVARGSHVSLQALLLLLLQLEFILLILHVSLIIKSRAAMENGEDDEAYLLKNSETLSQEDKDLLNLYHSTFDDDKVDIDLIVCLLIKIHSLPQPGIIVHHRLCFNNYLLLRPLSKIIIFCLSLMSILVLLCYCEYSPY